MLMAVGIRCLDQARSVASILNNLLLLARQSLCIRRVLCSISQFLKFYMLV